MNLIVDGRGDLPLMCDDPKFVAFDGLESWQVDQLTDPIDKDSLSQSNMNLQAIDNIVGEWIKQLSPEEWQKIKRQKSLYGIKLPDKWIVVWRIILKEPKLRNSDLATKGGRAIGSYSHLWNLWSEECIEKYLSPMEKDLLSMVDAGLLYAEIGDIMLSRYGDDFWKPRKQNTKTTPSQVVNNYLYLKMPNKIARSELTDLILLLLKNKIKK